jgi:mono/diheme cytochrome c family protein
MTVVSPRAARALAGALLTAAAVHASAADPQRGAMLFATPPASGLLACADCHGADPQVNNFGNIWAGRNAVALIQRAVQANTGGMGYFGGFYGSADFADIAAYLGNAPAALVFDPTELGRDSAPQSVSITTSTKIGVGALQLRTEGDFVVSGSSCGTELPRFANCAVDLSFRPSAAGQRSGSLLITHDGTPTPVRIALAGLATARPAAIARLEPAQLAFVAAGPAGVQSANVLNDSAERLTLGSITASTAAFRVVGGSCRPGALLLPGRRCQVALRFDPSGVGAAAGTLTGSARWPCPHAPTRPCRPGCTPKHRWSTSAAWRPAPELRCRP